MKLLGKCLITFVVVAFFAANLFAGERQVSIIPVPSSLVQGEGEYVLLSGRIVCVPFNDELQSIVRYLNGKIEPASGIMNTTVRAIVTRDLTQRSRSSRCRMALTSRPDYAAVQPDVQTGAEQRDLLRACVLRMRIRDRRPRRTRTRAARRTSGSRRNR